MERIPLALVLLFFLPVTSSAQKGFHVGGSIGFHNSWLVNEQDDSDEKLQKLFTPGGSGGALVSFYITPAIAVRTEFLFSYQGQAYFQERRIEDLRWNRSLLYFKSPLMLEFRTSLIENSFFKGHFGAYISSPLKASRQRDGEEIEAPGELSWEDAYRSPVLGAVAGLGLGKRWGRGWASTLELRFDHDLTNAEERTSDLIPPRRDETYNATLGLMLHLRYAFQEQAASRKTGAYP